MDNAPMPNRTNYDRRNPVVARAHAVNELPWKPLSGHVKRRCTRCGFWFSSPDRSRNQQLACQDCEIELRRERQR